MPVAPSRPGRPGSTGSAGIAPGGKSCATCPSFLVGPKQTVNLGANLAAPICGLKMLPLVMPKQGPETSARVLSHNAKSCDKYGNDVKLEQLGAREAPNFLVGMETDLPEPDPSEPTGSPNCLNCANYVNSSSVNEVTGWTASICRATGNLMPDVRLQYYAQQCGRYVRQIGPRSKTPLKNFVFLPIFSENFGKIDVAKGYRDRLAEFIDPKNWPTDRPVSDKARSRGIKAWRRVVDPEGYGEDVYLPVYDETFILANGKPFLTESERALIPRTGDNEHPELYADHGGLTYGQVVTWIKLDDTSAWWGQGGTGKTEFGRYLAWLMQLPFYRINITGSSELDDIAGKMLFENNETKFTYGRLPKAWMRPSVILLDEPNTGPNEVWQFIRPLTDNSRMLVLDQNKGERITRHNESYFALAMNPAWDPRNTGAHEIGDADSSRLMHTFFSYPPRDLEIEILQRRLDLDGWRLPDDKMNSLMKVCDELRAASASGVLHTTWGVRHQLKVARAMRWFPPVKAYQRAAGDALDPQQWEAMMTIIRSHFVEA